MPEMASRADQESATTTLVTDSEFGGAREACVSSLAESAAERNVLAVLLTGTVDGWLDRWRDATDARPGSLGFVTADEQFRSAAARDGGAERVQLGEGAAARSISNPADLTGLEIAVAEFLSEWAGDGRETVVCVDSLTVLLQYAELPAAFRFLNSLTSRVWHADATMHVHLDPAAVDDRVLATVAPLFDAVEGDV